MRVLLAAHSAELAGAERDVLELAQALSLREDVGVEVVVPRRGPLLDALSEHGLTTHVVASRWWASDHGHAFRQPAFLARNLVAMPRAVRLLRTRMPDLVVTFSLTQPVFALAARRIRLPHVWVAREFRPEDHDFRFHFGRARSMRLVDSLSAIVAVPSDAVSKQLMEWIAPAKLRLLRYAAMHGDPSGGERPRTRRTSALRLLCVGTVRESKGSREAIEALSRLQDRGTAAELVFVGSGRRGYIRSLQRQVQRLGLGDVVTFTGFVRDPTAFYDAADVVLLCSRSEAYARVVIEAMKRGVPVVGSAAGGTVQQITESDGGLLYDPGDATALAAAVGRLYDDRDLLIRLGANGRRWATQNFSLERLAAEFLAIADEAVRGGGDTPPS